MRPTVCLILIVLAWGCAPFANREQLANEVLKADPSFEAQLTKHRELENRIETFQKELALKRSSVERNITQLRKDLADTTSKVRQKIAEVKKRIEPDQKRLELSLSMADEGLRAKRAERASVGRSIAKLRKAAKGERTAWTPEERSRREAQLTELLNDAARLDQEIAGLKRHVRLLKIKLLLIKL